MSIAKTIYFRADANAKIGYGHLFRCIAVNSMLKEHFRTRFFSETSHEFLLSILYKEDPLYQTGDPNKAFFDTIDEHCIAVLDGYHFDAHYQERVKAAGACCVCIDDDQPFHYIADVVINHADVPLDKYISREAHTRLCTGFEYLMLRKEFLDYAQKNLPVAYKPFERIFCSFGGTDQAKVINKILEAVNYVPGVKSIHLVVSSKTDLQNDWINNTRPYSLQLYHDLSVDKMLQLMLSCQVALVPSSTISLECYTAGLYLLTGQTAINQKHLLEGIANKPGVMSLNQWDEVTVPGIARSLLSLNEKAKNSGSFFRKIDSRFNFIQLFSGL